jgi:hypothetical protein
MALEGTFKDFPITDILQLIGLQRKTGLLTLEANEQEIRIFFSEGNVISVEDSLRNREERLGVMLTNVGSISKGQLEEALARQRRTRERLGFILRQMGYIKVQDLEKALARQVFETTSQIFRWKEGRYRFSSQRISHSMDCLAEPIPIENLLLEAMRMIDEWPLIEREIPSPDSLLTRAPSGSEKAGLEDADEDGRRILGLVDGKKSVREIIGESHLSDFDTCKILAGFVSSGILKVKASTGPIAEGPPLAPSSRRGLQVAISFLLSFMAVGLVLANVFILHPDISNLIPFAASGERKEALAKSYLAKLEIEGWIEAARQFYAKRESWPSNLEDFKLEGQGRKLQEKDPWGNPYRFQWENAALVIMSMGGDGIKGTGDDITERQLL